MVAAILSSQAQARADGVILLPGDEDQDEQLQASSGYLQAVTKGSQVNKESGQIAAMDWAGGDHAAFNRIDRWAT